MILGWGPSQLEMFGVGLGHRVSRGPMCGPQPHHAVIKQSFISLLVSASDEDYKPYFPTGTALPQPWVCFGSCLAADQQAEQAGSDRGGGSEQAARQTQPQPRAFWTCDPPPRGSSPRHMPRCACSRVQPSLPAPSCPEEFCRAVGWPPCRCRRDKESPVPVACSRAAGATQPVPRARKGGPVPPPSPAPAALAPQTLRGAFLRQERDATPSPGSSGRQAEG